MPAMQGGALCIPFGEKKSLHKKTVREKLGSGAQLSVKMPWTQSGRSEGASVNIGRGKWSPLTTCLRITRPTANPP